LVIQIEGFHIGNNPGWSLRSASTLMATSIR
jgi:hypothetical protein